MCVLISSICVVGALQVLALALDQLLAMLHRLLEPRDLGSDAVVARLDGVEPLVAIRELDAQLLDRGLGRALRRDRGLERELLLANARSCSCDLGAQRRQAQREQLGADACVARP